MADITTTTAETTIPSDIAEVFGTLGILLLDLTDTMAEDVKEWRSDLRQAVREWKAGGKEPDWQSFREWMNDICQDDGMPGLFAAEAENEPAAAVA